METYFEKIRREKARKKIGNTNILAVITTVLFILLLVVTVTIHILYIVILIPIGFLISGQLKIIADGKKGLQDIRDSSFYKTLTWKDMTPEEVVSSVSMEIEEKCLYHTENVYITENWIIDFSHVEVKIINIDQIVWIYGIVNFGTSYVRCYMDNSSEYALANVSAAVVVSTVQQQRTNILCGYNNKYETLMRANPTLFISNIKSGKFPTSEGTWK